MSDAYCRSTDGNDADDGSTWALADAGLVNALVDAGATTNRVFVSDNHAQTGAGTITLASAGTASSPTDIICGDDAAEPPTAVATTGTVSVTGGTSINYTGFAYVYGLTFNAASGANSGSHLFESTTPFGWVFDTCALKVIGTGSGGLITFGASGSGDDCYVRLINSTMNFAAAGQTCRMRSCRFVMSGGSVTGTAPTAFVTPSSSINGSASALFIGVDLSNISTALVNVAGGATGLIEFIDCKTHASVAYVTGTRPSAGGVNVRIINCSASDVNYFYFWDCYEGSITSETVIVRTGGASDGVTPLSYKMVSSANTKFHLPLTSEWTDSVEVWNEATGSSKTATIEIITDNVTLTDAEAWIEVEYLGTSGVPLGAFANDRATNILSTPANQTTSSETWTTTGLTTPVKQALAVAFTPQEKGVIRARVCLAKASTTAYFCPKLTVA